MPSEQSAHSAPLPSNGTPGAEANSASSDPIIRVKHLSAEYDGKSILKDINFEVRRREVLVIAGESGSGKSTLLRHMIGLEAPKQGKVEIEGEDLASATGDERRRILRKIGVAFQTSALFGSMGVLENVRLPLETFTRLPSEMIDLLALTKLQLVGLASEAQKEPAELSGGMQKRAAIARALALDPAIIFLDEPSAALDPFTSAELDQLVLTLRRLLNMTFVIVSHQLASIFTIADRVLLLDVERKTIVADGNPKELRESSPDRRVRAFFNREAIPKTDPAAGSAEIDQSPVGKVDRRHETISGRASGGQP